MKKENMNKNGISEKPEFMQQRWMNYKFGGQFWS